jgi:hypothetical protein
MCFIVGHYSVVSDAVINCGETKMRYKVRYLRRKTQEKKEIPKAWFGLICVIIGGLISPVTSFGNTYFGNILRQRDNKNADYYAIMNGIAELETIISEEFYIYMSMRESLAGHELYG